MFIIIESWLEIHGSWCWDNDNKNCGKSWEKEFVRHKNILIIIIIIRDV